MSSDDVRSVTPDEQPTAVAEAELPVAEIGPWLGRAYQAVDATCGAQGRRPTGPPFARYHRLDEARFAVEAGYHVDALVAWIRRRGGEPTGDAWEIYLSRQGPDPATWRTEIVQPYRTT